MRKIQLQYEGKEAAASTLRTFDIGHCLEDLVAEWLKIAGFNLRTRNENGELFGFSTAEGRIKGHVDGADGTYFITRHWKAFWRFIFIFKKL